MNFDLAWLQSHLGDIRAVHQAVEKDINMPPNHCMLLISVARGRGQFPAPASCSWQQQLLRSKRGLVASTVAIASAIVSLA